MTQRLDPLLPALRALEEQASAVHRRQMDTERRLLTELAELEDMRAKASREAAQLGVRQKLGVDGLWQGWLLQRRAQINRDLAMCRAQGAATLQAAQLAYARRAQTEALIDQTRAARSRAANRKDQDTLDHLVTLNAFTRLR